MLPFVSFAANAVSPIRSPEPTLTFVGRSGPGHGKTIVLVSGDEEYRSEEALPQLARILAERHGFTCIVLFAIDPKDGTIAPNVTNDIPGLELLRKADLLVLFTRMRDLPDDQMKHVVDYVESGKPIVAMRTATHAFKLSSATYARFTWDSREPGWEGGFGTQILGETWVSHHGEHGKQGTRGVAAPGQEGHAILRGIAQGAIFGPTDVYTVRLPLPEGCTPIVLGQVAAGLTPDAPAAPTGNDPMLPVAWTRIRRMPNGRSARVFATTMGASQDLLYEGTRRMLVNGVYWSLGLETRIPPKSNVDLVGDYHPTPFRFRTDAEWKPGRKPVDM